MPAQRVRCFVFTWNNPPDNALELLKAHEEFKYCVFQLEKVTTPHLQGYVELQKQMSLSKVGKLHGWHIEPRKGSQKQAIAYCTKEESRQDGPWEFGEKSNAGKRNDIASMYESIKLGKRERDIAEEMPEIHAKYFRAHDRYRSLIDYDSTKNFRRLTCDVYWGGAGSGKTRKAVESAEDDYYILNSPGANGMVWWDGYKGEKTLIIDDFYGWIKYSMLLRILDGYQMRLQIKGGFTYAKWEHVVITSNKQVVDWYPNVADQAALKRRIDDIIKM